MQAAGRSPTKIGDAGLAGLVDNAGIVVPGRVEALPLDELRRQLEVNVVGSGRGHPGAYLPRSQARGGSS